MVITKASGSVLIPYVQAMLEKGRVEVPFPDIVRPLILPAVVALKRLIAEPAEYRDLWEFQGLYKKRDDGKPDSGLFRREAVNDDNKWVFHYGVLLESALRERGVQIGPYYLFLSSCEEILRRCRNFKISFFAALDEVLPGYHFYQRAIQPAADWADVLRLVVYDPASAGDIIATPHTDMSCVTLHLWDSWGILRVGPERTGYITAPGKALAFPGRKMQLLTGGREIPATKGKEIDGGMLIALEHDVMETRNYLSGEEQRAAAIYFGNIDMDAQSSLFLC